MGFREQRQEKWPEGLKQLAVAAAAAAVAEEAETCSRADEEWHKLGTETVVAKREPGENWSFGGGQSGLSGAVVEVVVEVGTKAGSGNGQSRFCERGQALV